jgi:hypothetical protein
MNFCSVTTYAFILLVRIKVKDQYKFQLNKMLLTLKSFYFTKFVKNTPNYVKS